MELLYASKDSHVFECVFLARVSSNVLRTITFMDRSLVTVIVIKWVLF